MKVFLNLIPGLSVDRLNFVGGVVDSVGGHDDVRVAGKPEADERQEVCLAEEELRSRLLHGRVH